MKANQPKALTGISDEKPFDMNARAVVLEVASSDLDDLLNMYAILLW